MRLASRNHAIVPGSETSHIQPVFQYDVGDRHATWLELFFDLSMGELRGVAIAGMTLFYLGKQISYYLAFPTIRRILVINTIVCISVTLVSTFLPRPEYTLIGITVGMLFYVYSNFRWTLTKDMSEFLSEAESEAQSLPA